MLFKFVFPYLSFVWLFCCWEWAIDISNSYCRIVYFCLQLCQIFFKYFGGCNYESECEVAQSCPTLSDPIDYSLPGTSIHGVFQAKILEWVAIFFSRRSFRPRDWTQVSHIAGRLFTSEPPVQFSSVAQSCPTLCNPMNLSTPGLPVHHQLPEFTQTHVHRIGDAIQPSHPLSSPSPPAFNHSQHQSLFQWVNSSHEVAKVLEFQPQHQSFQWTPRTDLL